MQSRVVMSWSGGKDCALALYHLLKQNQQYEVMGLLTVIDEHEKKVNMHNVDERLIEAQAYAIGLPLHKVYVSENSTQYEKRMSLVQ
jgi:diphthamide synthase (EF-2-diphthine--ammonia ligase)